MKVNPMVKFVLFAVFPLLVIYVLFRINTVVGFIGLAAYLLFAVSANRALIYRIRGQAEYSKGNLKNAAIQFEKAIRLKKAGVEMKINYGFILLKIGRLEEAEKVLQECVSQGKTQDEKNLAKSNLALVLWRKGRLEQAISMLKEIIVNYKTTAIYGSLGYLLIEQGDMDEALKFNLEAFEYNSENAIILDNLAHLYHLRGEMDKAGEMFEKLKEKNPHFPEAWYDFGRYLEDSGRGAEAAEMYEKALSCTFSFNSTISSEQVQNRLNALEDRSEKPSRLLNTENEEKNG